MPSAGSRTETSTRVGAFVLAPVTQRVVFGRRRAAPFRLPTSKASEEETGRESCGRRPAAARGPGWGRVAVLLRVPRVPRSSTRAGAGLAPAEGQPRGWHRPRHRLPASPAAQPELIAPPPGRPSARAAEWGIFPKTPPSPSPGGGGGGLYLVFKRGEGEKKNKN